jgi:hypothetical protein
MGSPIAFANRKLELNIEHAVEELSKEIPLKRANRAARQFRSEDKIAPPVPCNEHEQGELAKDLGRFKELLDVQKKRDELIQDKEVYADMYNSASPLNRPTDRWMLRYLEQSVLGYINGPNAFVHGGISTANMGYVPGHVGRFPDLYAWLDALNVWSSNRVQDFVQSQGRSFVGDLLDYSLPITSPNCLRLAKEGISIVTSSWLEKGNAVPLSPELEKFLDDAGVKCLVTGHQPHGDCPQIIRGTGNAMVVMADTSYSDNPRRLAYCAVNCFEDRLVVAGALKGGEKKHGYTLFYDKSAEHPPQVDAIGRQCVDESWVKTVLEDGKTLLVVRGEGFQLHSKEQPLGEIRLKPGDFASKFEGMSV